VKRLPYKKPPVSLLVAYCILSFRVRIVKLLTHPATHTHKSLARKLYTPSMDSFTLVDDLSTWLTSGRTETDGDASTQASDVPIDTEHHVDIAPPLCVVA